MTDRQLLEAAARAAGIVALALLAACDVTKPPESRTILDQCLRAQLFQQCLAAVPKGPQVTHDNPWHKVVDECAGAAMYQSYRLREHVKQECRAE